MNIEQARYNMVEQQIRPWDVLDQGVLDLLFRVKREDFVPARYRGLAFADTEIPLGGRRGQAMWSPKLEARVLQELDLVAGEHVLEVGTGSGYFTALMCARGATVHSVEIDDTLAAAARRALAAHGMTSVRVDIGDGARGWGVDVYDAIVLTGSTPILPEAFFRQLKPSGRVFAIVGDAPAMTAQIVRHAAPGSRVTTTLFETVVAPLVDAEAPSRFTF
ncbi:MAG: protein-L-isoaspartate O-methyltransferase [Proteobacteria bacterium]|nr:protein-L-isoaspartate O-methyltransferase [Pseudomonadota bacterium]